LSERSDVRLRQRIGFDARQEHADPQHPIALLRVRCERPRRRAAESSDEFTPSKAHLSFPCQEALSDCPSQQLNADAHAWLIGELGALPSSVNVAVLALARPFRAYCGELDVGGVVPRRR
jgi:hypothetical protein